ncbi:MAG: DegT/DnrJ/EryC1/StrS family aminotransferase [Candidatus Bathyarchaeia archaeon]
MGEKLAILGGEPYRKASFPPWPILGEEEVKAVTEVLSRGQLSSEGGVEVPRLEEEFAKAIGADYAVAVASGTAALDVAVAALGIGPGDEVVTPAYSFISSATCILQSCGLPIFADVDLETRCMTPDTLQAALTDNSKAVIPVHFAGQPADMDGITEIAQRRGLRVVEDAAQAHLAEFKGRRVGSIGDLGCFSFYQSKNMAAGEGGIITTNDKALAELCDSLRRHGRMRGKPWYAHYRLGWNYRMPELTAAICRVQLKRLPTVTEQRRRGAEYLSKKLQGLEGVKPPTVASNVKHVFHLYCLSYDPHEVGVSKTRFVKALAAEGIPITEGYVTPLYENPIFQDREARGKTCIFTCSHLGRTIEYPRGLCPNAERLCYEIGPWLRGSVLNASERDLDDVVGAIEKVLGNAAKIP